MPQQTNHVGEENLGICHHQTEQVIHPSVRRFPRQQPVDWPTQNPWFCWVMWPTWGLFAAFISQFRNLEPEKTTHFGESQKVHSLADEPSGFTKLQLCEDLQGCGLDLCPHLCHRVVIEAHALRKDGEGSLSRGVKKEHEILPVHH